MSYRYCAFFRNGLPNAGLPADLRYSANGLENSMASSQPRPKIPIGDSPGLPRGRGFDNAIHGNLPRLADGQRWKGGPDGDCVR